MEDKQKKSKAISSKDDSNQAQTTATKKAYSKPTLTDHGSVLELTQTGGSNTADFFGGLQP